VLKTQAKSTAQESGHALVEVMVALVVLTVAVVPMVGMFDAAIGAADASADYDKRGCAPYRSWTVEEPSVYEAVEGGRQSGVCNPSGFGYTIAAQSIGTDLGDSSGEEGLTMFTVTVDWDSENSYIVSGVVSRW
jgi:hypothetical protein